MNKTVFVGALALTGLSASLTVAGTLDDVKARGKLNCGVAIGVAGFAAPDANGEWQGFDVAICRAVAAAVLNDPAAVNFIPTTGKARFTALAKMRYSSPLTRRTSSICFLFTMRGRWVG